MDTEMISKRWPYFSINLVEERNVFFNDKKKTND